MGREKEMPQSSTSPPSICTSTSSPSTRTGYTSTLPFSGAAAIPVVTSNAQACQGHSTAPSSIHPPPNGPCRCGQTFPSADSRPSTFAKQIGKPRASASITSPTLGASAAPHNRTHCPTPASFNRTYYCLLRCHPLACFSRDPDPPAHTLSSRPEAQPQWRDPCIGFCFCFCFCSCSCSCSCRCFCSCFCRCFCFCFCPCTCFSSCHSERSEEPASRSRSERPFLPLLSLSSRPRSQRRVRPLLVVAFALAILSAIPAGNLLLPYTSRQASQSHA